MAFATRQLRNLTTGACNPMMRVLCTSSPLRLLRNQGIQGRAPTRCYCSNTSPKTPLHQFPFEVMGVCSAVSPSVVAILSYFSGSETREIPHSARRGTGVFVDPSLILTSARLVGKVSSVFNSDRRSVLHNCFIGRTIALTCHGEVICTSPVAVNFAGDVAVLKVLNPKEVEENPPAPCAVANGIADDYCPLLGIARHENSTALSIIFPGRRRVEKCDRPKAPWPLDDKLEWADYAVRQTNDSGIVSLADISGSPWFNYQCEVVGIASWTAETADERIHSFAVPPLYISSIIDYAKTKGPHDPVIMDRWINAHSFPDHDSPIFKECVPPWPRNVVTQMYV